MNKIKKYSLMCIISIIILILCRSGCVYANDIAVYLGENRDGWFCVQRDSDPVNGAVKDGITYTYTSNSGSQFERAFAYLLKSAKESKQNPGLPTNDFRIGMYPVGWDKSNYWTGSQPCGGMHQNCLWKLIYEANKNGTATAPFNVKNSYGEVNAIDFNAIKTSWGFTKEEANELYNKAIKAKQESYVENVDIKTDGLKMNAETNIGSLKITKLSGTIQNIKIYWADNTNEQISTNKQGANFQIYSNKECTQTRDISSIKASETIYIKNKKNSDIVNMEIEVGQKESGQGYKVTFELYESPIRTKCYTCNSSR